MKEALEKEKVELDFLPYSDGNYNPVYFSSICEKCFSIKSKDIKISEIVIMTKVEPVAMKDLVAGTSTGTLSYLFIKDGNLVDTRNISLPFDELSRFVAVYRMSSVLLTNFTGFHRDLKDKEVGHITMTLRAFIKGGSRTVPTWVALSIAEGVNNLPEGRHHGARERSTAFLSIL